MMGSNSRRWTLRAGLLVVAIMAPVWMTGCQIDVGGQTLPSAYYLQDDVQYFPPGPEFKLAREAAAMKQYTQEQALQR